MTKDSHNITTGADIYTQRMEEKTTTRQTVVRYCWEQPLRAWQRFAVDQTVAYLFFSSTSSSFSAYMYVCIALYLTLYPPLL